MTSKEKEGGPVGSPEMVILNREVVKEVDRALEARGYKHGGSDGQEPPVTDRLTRLETKFEFIERDLSEIRTDMRSTLVKLGEMPTKRDLDSWKWQWAGIALAVIVLAISGIVGGLALINRAVEPPPSAPAVIVQPPVIPAPAASVQKPPPCKNGKADCKPWERAW